MSDLKEWMNPLIPADTRVQIADGEIERLRGITNTPHFKPRSRADLKYLSHDELVSDVIRFELKYLHRSSMFFRLDQSHEKLRAELAASREREARMQWQPIETAPRDGTMVLLAGGLAAPSDWRIKVGYWASEDGAWYIFGGSWRPTRWMPLDGLYAALAEGAQG